MELDDLIELLQDLRTELGRGDLRVRAQVSDPCFVTNAYEFDNEVVLD